MPVFCGHCKRHHPEVQDVRACAQGHASVATINAALDFGLSEAAFIDRNRFQPAAPKVNWVEALKVEGAKLPDVEHASYALFIDGHWKFYRVDKPTEGKWAGCVYVKLQAGDEVFPLRGPSAVEIAQLIAADPIAAATAYGRQLGKCSICGRTLTNPASIEAGIGPICAGRF